MGIYNASGTIADKTSEFIDNMDFDYEFDSTSNANYTIIRIYKTKIDGSKQYPFVFAPNGSSSGTMSTLTMMSAYPVWNLGINGGIFTEQGVADGIVIQNGVSVINTPAITHYGAYPLTINDNGDLSYAAADANTSTLIANNIKSAVCGFCPIVVDYAAVDASFYNWITHYNENAQRQIIGQFGNGDYAIITCEGRNHQASDGWTIPEAIAVCLKHGLKFAYNLDGGGSTETVLCRKHINDIYDNTTGRIVPTFICFSGGDSFPTMSGGVPCTGIALNENTLDLTSIGGTATLTATPTPADTTDSISWSTSDASVATVADGVVTAVGLGTATITVTCGSQTATCAVTVDNVVPDYVMVAGYSPSKRSADAVNPSMTTNQVSSATVNSFIIAANKATGMYPIESKTTVDTSPYRFVPILIPAGATKIKLTASSYDQFYTRFLWCDSTKQETIVNHGAWCVQGKDTGWDQPSRATNTYTITIPTGVSGLDSFCAAFNSSYSTWETGTDYASSFSVEFLSE